MRNRYILLLLGAMACTAEQDLNAPDDGGGTAEDSATAELHAARRIGQAHTAFSGGATTVFDVSPDAFSLGAPNLQGLNLGLHEVGDVAFEIEFDPGKGPHRGIGPGVRQYLL